MEPYDRVSEMPAREIQCCSIKDVISTNLSGRPRAFHRTDFSKSYCLRRRRFIRPCSHSLHSPGELVSSSSLESGQARLPPIGGERSGEGPLGQRIHHRSTRVTPWRAASEGMSNIVGGTYGARRHCVIRDKPRRWAQIHLRCKPTRVPSAR